MKTGMKVAIFQHMETEGPGFFPDLLRSRGIPFEIHRLYETGEAPAGISSPLIIMGGGMSVHDEKEYSFLAQEKEIIRKLHPGREAAGRDMPRCPADRGCHGIAGVSRRKGVRVVRNRESEL